ncbi:MAG: hypothetical protein LBE12_04870 [Planctomycetaceae bacterium]|jgi:hypothetical protein|nr:hypothetical protein [Planctomycetaceae bacterium]
MKKRALSVIAVLVVIVIVAMINVNLNSQSSKSNIVLFNLEALSGEHYLSGVQRGYQRSIVWRPSSMTISGDVGTSGVGMGESITYTAILCCTRCISSTPSQMSGCDFDMEDSECINWVSYT